MQRRAEVDLLEGPWPNEHLASKMALNSSSGVLALRGPRSHGMVTEARRVARCVWRFACTLLEIH